MGQHDKCIFFIFTYTPTKQNYPGHRPEPIWMGRVDWVHLNRFGLVWFEFVGSVGIDLIEGR